MAVGYGSRRYQAMMGEGYEEELSGYIRGLEQELPRMIAAILGETPRTEKFEIVITRARSLIGRARELMRRARNIPAMPRTAKECTRLLIFQFGGWRRAVEEMMGLAGELEAALRDVAEAAERETRELLERARRESEGRPNVAGWWRRTLPEMVARIMREAEGVGRAIRGILREWAEIRGKIMERLSAGPCGGALPLAQYQPPHIPSEGVKAGREETGRPIWPWEGRGRIPWVKW